MGKFQDLTGQEFGRLVVLRRAPNYGVYTQWVCCCRGPHEPNEIIVMARSLQTSNTLSCGCLRREQISERRHKHGMSESKIYQIWLAMKARCRYSNSACYKNYGGRGIKVTKRWRDSFFEFLKDMGRRPSSKHEIDRIDNLIVGR